MSHKAQGWPLPGPPHIFEGTSRGSCPFAMRSRAIGRSSASSCVSGIIDRLTGVNYNNRFKLMIGLIRHLRYRGQPEKPGAEGLFFIIWPGWEAQLTSRDTSAGPLMLEMRWTRHESDQCTEEAQVDSLRARQRDRPRRTWPGSRRLQLLRGCGPSSRGSLLMNARVLRRSPATPAPTPSHPYHAASLPSECRSAVAWPAINTRDRNPANGGLPAINSTPCEW